MSQPSRAKTLEEVEEEVEALGLTNETAAAIVRLANTLKRVRKLRREHIELLTPGRRIHPPSPLSQPVWKQAETEKPPQPDGEAEACCLNEANNVEATDAGLPEDAGIHSLDDAFLPSMASTALTAVVSRVGDISLSEEHPSPSEVPNVDASPDKDEDDTDLSNNESSKS
ncbi:hypothetical protein ACHAQJ_005669 [Trichoderma viride]